MHDANGTLLDTHAERFGIRALTFDARQGLRINGKCILLNGGCVHHDNGILGAATLPQAEYRRARIMKEQGFNAVRSAHNPLSKAFLDACDELGLLVMDEAFDMVVPELLRTLVFARPCGGDQFAAGTVSPSLDMSR